MGNSNFGIRVYSNFGIIFTVVIMGHSSINITVDTYGKWLPAGNKDAINKLNKAVSASEAQKSENEVLAKEMVAKWQQTYLFQCFPIC